MFSLEIRRGKNRDWRDKSYRNHRLSFPSYIHWYGGRKRSESYHMNGDLHREDGPAVILWDSNSKRWRESYFLRGVKREKL